MLYIASGDVGHRLGVQEGLLVKSGDGLIGLLVGDEGKGGGMRSAREGKGVELSSLMEEEAEEDISFFDPLFDHSDGDFIHYLGREG